MRLAPHNLTPPGPTCPCDHCDYEYADKKRKEQR